MRQTVIQPRILGEINRNRVLDLLKSNPDHSYSVLEVSSILKLADSSVRNHLYRLENYSQIVCTQNNNRQAGKKKLFKLAKC